jgi:hypothetical protein
MLLVTSGGGAGAGAAAVAVAAGVGARDAAQPSAMQQQASSKRDDTARL